MIFDKEDLINNMGSPILFNPVDNRFDTRQFELRDSFYSDCSKMLSELNGKSSREDRNKRIILSEVLENKNIRNRIYTEVNNTLVDNVNLHCCLGADSDYHNQIYGAIYDISEMVYVVLAILFNDKLSTIKENVKKLCAEEGWDPEQLLYVLGDGFNPANVGITLHVRDFGRISKAFTKFCNECWRCYAANALVVGDMQLFPDVYSAGDALVVFIKVYIARAMECILNGIETQVYNDSCNELYKASIHSKGLSNVFFSSRVNTGFKDVVVRFRGNDIVIKPWIEKLENIGDLFLNMKSGGK